MQHILPKHGTRAYGYPTVAGCNANRTPITCPFCSGPTTIDGPHITLHREYLGYTLCPASGKTPTEGAVLATALLDDYLLPNESAYSQETTS